MCGRPPATKDSRWRYPSFTRRNGIGPPGWRPRVPLLIAELELSAGLLAREPSLISDIIVNAPACTEKIMRTWLEHDPVALAVLVVGIAAVELLALSL